jgi:fatty acid desaturase
MSEIETTEKAEKKGRQIKWYRTPIDRELLTQLSQRSDLLGFRQVLGYYGLQFGLFGLALYSFDHWHWAITAACVYGYGIVASFGGGCATHELTHNTVFRTKWLNEAFAKFAGLTSWWSPVWFQISHLRHHAYTLHQPDDLEVTQPQRMPSGLWAHFTIIVTNPQGFYGTVRNTVKTARGKLNTKWDEHLFRDDPERHQRLKNFARMTLAIHATVLIACVTLAITLKLWFLLLVPLMFSYGPFIGGWLVTLCGLPQHYGLVDGVPDFRLSCRTYTTNPLCGLLYWQMQYHIDHHMFPTVPCYNLKKLHKAIKHDLPPTPQGLWACWRDMRAIAKKQRENPNYLHRVTLPQDAVNDVAAGVEAPVVAASV